MRFRRQHSQQTGRQRIKSNDLPPKPASFSYRSRRSDEEFGLGRHIKRKSSEVAESRVGRFWLQRFGLVVLLLAVLFSAVNILSLSGNSKVMPLTGSQDTPFLRDLAVYEEAANRYLADSIWNRNKITVSTSAVSQKMLDKFPELASVSVTVPLFAHRPIVYIEPSQPALVLVAQNGSFVVSSSGKALLKGDTPEALHQPKLPVLNDQSGLRISLNKQALPKGDVDFIQTIVPQLSAKGFSVVSLNLPAGTSELDVQLTDKPYIVKFNLQSERARQQVGTFLATIDYLQKQNIVPTKYVDARVDGRAYYQ